MEYLLCKCFKTVQFGRIMILHRLIIYRTKLLLILIWIKILSKISNEKSITTIRVPIKISYNRIYYFYCKIDSKSIPILDYLYGMLLFILFNQYFQLI